MSAGSLDQDALNVLAFCPTPTHPAVQGNRQRVSDICRAMQTMGAKVTVLYYAAEAITSEDALEMTSSWDGFEIVYPRTLEHKRSLVRHPAIDDWYDNEITLAVSRIISRRRFDICVVNYVWYSKLLEVLPESVVRVIDTHDIFGGRAEKFADIGLDPAWFHTSVAQEKSGLDRADYVIAIQDEEARLLQDRTRARVSSVGRLSPDDYLPVREKPSGEPLIVGYVGSGNPFNVASMLCFAAAAQARPDLLEKVQFRLAGPICNQLKAVSHPFRLCGIVDSIAEFYRGIDVAINPMLGGTGLKIKSLEAMGFGKPLIATRDAMTGIATDHPGHALSSPASMLDYLSDLASRPALLASEASASRSVYRRYHDAQLRAFLEIWSDISVTAYARRSNARRHAQYVRPHSGAAQ